jgi:hypothetical protein
MANFDFGRIRQAPWKVDVFDRLSRVEEDVNQALSVKGWSLVEHTGGWTISPLAGPVTDDQERVLHDQAQAVVAAIFGYIDKTRECLTPPDKRRQRVRDRLTGGPLMSAYTSLHAAEASRVLLFSADQLAAALPVIRQRAAAYLAKDDPRRVALDGITPGIGATATPKARELRTSARETRRTGGRSANAPGTTGTGTPGTGAQ